ncbi:MAG: lysylphosphatidylglycerol synthase transmembrane domain-containing protein, partial [Desulfocapsaceae bacterium]|nr:lysylphosphatidylglycerol synthase transmembrane domain-containing protein [Desulfocapsaceae bacterium]
LMRKIGVNVGYLESYFLLVGMQLGNYLPMRAGTVIRMNYFKKVHKLNYLTFSGLFGAKTFIMIASTCLLGCVGLVGIWMTENTQKLTWLLVIYLGIAAFAILASFIRLPVKNNSQNFVIKAYTNFSKGYKAISEEPTLMFKLFVLQILQCLALSLRFWISFEIIGKELNLSVYLILAPTTLLISIFSITPGNLGLREWFIGLLTVAIGSDLESGIFAGSIDRAILIATTFIVGSCSMIYIRIRMLRLP